MAYYNHSNPELEARIAEMEKDLANAFDLHARDCARIAELEREQHDIDLACKQGDLRWTK